MDMFNLPQRNPVGIPTLDDGFYPAHDQSIADGSPDLRSLDPRFYLGGFIHGLADYQGSDLDSFRAGSRPHSPAGQSKARGVFVPRAGRCVLGALPVTRPPDAGREHRGNP